MKDDIYVNHAIIQCSILKRQSCKSWFCIHSGKKERKEREKISLAQYTHQILQRFVGLSEYDHIKKMLNKNHLGNVPSKAAEC